MLGWLRQRFRSEVASILDERKSSSLLEALEDDSELGSQKGLDVEAPRYFAPIIALLPPFDLQKYLELWLNNSLAHAVVKAFVLLVVSDIEVVADNDDLKEYVQDFIRRIDLQTSLHRMVLDRAVYGFSPNEVVGDGPSLDRSTEIRGLFRLDPRSILAERTPFGKFRLFHQRLLSTLPPATSASVINFPFIQLDSDTVVFVHSPSPRTVYGQSILQAILARLDQREELIAASVIAAKNHSNQKIHWHYQLDPERREDKDEVTKQRKGMKTQITKSDEAGGKHIFSAGTGTYQTDIVGPPNVPDITKQIDLLTADIAVACGLSPSTLGFALGSGVTTSAASTRMTINNIVTEQAVIMAELNEKLFALLPFIESECPDGFFYCKFSSPTLETAKEQLEARTILLNNIGLELRAGSIGPQTAALELGRLTWFDEDRLETFLGQPTGEANPNDPNQSQQQRKAVDSLNDGKTPSNNPSGGNKANSNGNSETNKEEN